MKHKKEFKNFKNKNSDSKSSRPGQIGDISKEDKGEKISVEGIIDRIVQTGGPTVFYLSDGTGTLALKAFVGPGVRAHPEINEGDAIKATVRIEIFQDELEGEISLVSKLSGHEKQILISNLDKIQRDRAAITPPPFLVHSPILDKLKDSFIKAATEIRLAIMQNRPVIVRHHNDTDGYSAGYALERAIIPLIEKQHGGGQSPWEFYTRAPCAAPFYEIDDSIRDTANSLRNVAKFSNKLPLVIIADNGSSQEDLFAIKQGKVHGIDFIVVDHHFFEKDVISAEVLVHINPFLVGEDGSHFSAGMLCTELARFINPVDNVIPIAAMAGLADRINNPPVMDAYLKLAEKSGYTKELLGDISAVIDFVSAKLRFMEAREYLEVVFGEPMEKQKALVKVMAPYIKNLEEKGLRIAQSAAKIEKVGKTSLQLLYVEDTFSRGFYPKPGKCIGLLHDHLQTKGINNVVSVGVLADAFTIRATDAANFSVHDFIAYSQKHLPTSFVEGGGHKNAGAIKFLPSKQEEMLSLLKDFIKSRQ